MNRNLVLLIFILAFLFRLFLLPFGNHHDLLVNAEWGQTLFVEGADSFYQKKDWIYGSPTQFPLINLIYSYNFQFFGKCVVLFNFINEFLSEHNFFPTLFSHWFRFNSWFSWTYFDESPFMNGYLVVMKLIPLVFDLLTMLLVLFLAKKLKLRSRLLIPLLLGVAFMPFVWYESVLWGQYDQFSSFLAILSLFAVFLCKNKQFAFVLSSFLFSISFQIKPTVLFVFPLFLVFYFHLRPKVLTIIFALIVNLMFLFFTTLPFLGEKGFLEFFIQTIIPTVFNNNRYGLVGRAFNFWSLFAHFGVSSLDFYILGIKAFYIASLFLVAFVVLSIYLFLKNRNLIGALISLYLLSGGFYMFFIGVLDRYFYLPLIVLLIVALFNGKVFLSWLASSLIFSFNLFYSWGYPFLTIGEAWENFFLVRVGSFLSIFVFIFTSVYFLFIFCYSEKV